MANYTAHPPNRDKYHFNTLNVNDFKEIEGDYDLIRKSADRYRRNHGWYFLVTKIDSNKVKVLRYK